MVKKDTTRQNDKPLTTSLKSFGTDTSTDPLSLHPIETSRTGVSHNQNIYFYPITVILVGSNIQFDTKLINREQKNIKVATKYINGDVYNIKLDINYSKNDIRNIKFDINYSKTHTQNINFDT